MIWYILKDLYVECIQVELDSDFSSKVKTRDFVEGILQ